MGNSPCTGGKEAGRARALIIVALLVVLLLPAVYFFRSRIAATKLFSSITPSALAQAKTTPLVTSEVKRGAINKRLLLDGELRAVRSRTIFSNTMEDTKIVYLPPEGSIVKPGDRLVELDSTTVLTKIKEAEDKVIAADDEITRMKSNQEGALRDMEVELSKLWLNLEQAKIKANVPAEVVPRRDYQENILAQEKAKTEHENQLGKIEQRKKEQAADLQVKLIERGKLNTQIEQARSTLSTMNIKAPAEGMVIYNDHYDERRKMQIGDTIWGGYPVVFLPDMNEMEVLAPVNEVDGPRLSIGNKAQIMLDSFPNMVITGSIKEITQTAVKAGWDSKAKVFRVFISLDKTIPEIMKPGMSAQVSLSVAGPDAPTPLLIPRSAVNFEGGIAQVVRIEGENLKRPIAVTILSADAVHYAIADNGALKEGDRILQRWSK